MKKKNSLCMIGLHNWREKKVMNEVGDVKKIVKTCRRCEKQKTVRIK